MTAYAMGQASLARQTSRGFRRKAGLHHSWKYCRAISRRRLRVVLARRSYAETSGFADHRATPRSFAARGVDPKVMGIGPAVAIPEATRRAGIDVSDVQLCELNEAFASQATYCADGADARAHEASSCVNGGAIFPRSPARRDRRSCVGAAARDAAHGKHTGVVSMCIGSRRTGAAGVFAAE